MAIEVDRFSYLSLFSPVVSNNFTFWESIYLPDLSEPRDDDIEYIITEHDRIDLLSNRFYGTPRLWWVIALANKMANISTDFAPGKKILIPSVDFIDTLFGAI